MTRLRPDSIRAVGLKAYLNRTADKHDGYGYVEFKKYLDRGWGPTALARLFLVSKNTMLKWVDIYREEQGR